MKRVILLVLAFGLILAETDRNKDDEAYSAGFGDIDWVDLDQALALNQDQDEARPVFLLAHQPYCRFCKSTPKICRLIHFDSA